MQGGVVGGSLRVFMIQVRSAAVVPFCVDLKGEGRLNDS